MASDAAVGADFLDRCGIGQVTCVDSLLGALSLLHCGGPLAGGALTSLSSSGGEAALVADACVGSRVGFADLSPGQREALGSARFTGWRIGWCACTGAQRGYWRPSRSSMPTTSSA